MSTDKLQQKKYPIGKYKAPASYTQQDMQHWIAEIKALPAKMRQAVITLNEKQLDTPYRTGGWTIRQVVHHTADSHLNAFARFKFALTEDNPTIKPYEEADWALFADSKLPVEPALRMLEGLHQRWTALMEGMTEEQWGRTYFHPANNETTPLRKVLGLYAWHGNHHVAHITGAEF